METQVYEVIQKIHKMMTTPKDKTLTDSEVAYIVGQLEALLTVFGEPADEVKKKGFLSKFM